MRLQPRAALWTLGGLLALAATGCTTTPPNQAQPSAAGGSGATAPAATSGGQDAVAHPIPMLGGDGWDSPKLAEVGGKAMNDTFYSVHVDLSSSEPRVAAFVKAYRDRYKIDADTLGLLAYDSIYLLADAYRRAGSSDKEALRAALASTRGFAGVAGTITMNSDRDPVKGAVVVRMVDGKPRFAATMPPDGGEASAQQAAAPAPAAAAPAAAGQGPIRIGCFFAMTGSTASFGQSSMNGIRLALDEINAKGGVLGRQLEAVLQDDEGFPDKATLAVKKLISEEHVDCVLGDVASSNSIAGGTVAQEAKVPLLTPSSTNPKVTKVGSYVFRACFTDVFQGQVMARFASDQLHAHTAAILTDKASDYSMGLTRVFKETFEKSGGKIVGEEAYNGNDTDFKGQLTRLKGLAPDVLYVPGYYTEVGLMARQVRDLQMGTTLTLPPLPASGAAAPPTGASAQPAAPGAQGAPQPGPGAQGAPLKK